MAEQVALHNRSHGGRGRARLVRVAPLSVAAQLVVARVGGHEQLPDLGDVRELAGVLGYVRAGSRRVPIEVVEEDPAAGRK